MSIHVQASSSSSGLAVTTLVCSLQQSDPALQQQNIEHDIWAATQPHLPVEHGRLVEHLHLISCRMVTGAGDTSGGSVVGYNVAPSSPSCYPYWGLSLEGLTGCSIFILWLDADREVHAEQRHYALEAMAVYNMAHPSIISASGTPWIRLDCSTWSFVFRTAFDWARVALLYSLQIKMLVQGILTWQT